MNKQDFENLIRDYQDWKCTFVKLVERSNEKIKLNPDIIEQEGKSKLGQWINDSSIQKLFQDNPKFTVLEIIYGRFHKCASDIIRKVNNNEKTQALELLEKGCYTQTALKIEQTLRELQQEQQD